jgi:hypothetical protein
MQRSPSGWQLDNPHQNMTFSQLNGYLLEKDSIDRQPK